MYWRTGELAARPYGALGVCSTLLITGTTYQAFETVKFAVVSRKSVVAVMAETFNFTPAPPLAER